MYSTITKKQSRQRFKSLKPNATLDEIVWAAGLVSYDKKEEAPDTTPNPIDEKLETLRRMLQSDSEGSD